MKHKKLTMIVALVLVVALAAGLGIWATGETNVPTVTYYDGSDGNGARFTFTHTGDGSDTNLFPNFSNCMPGDSLTQTIRVQADGKNGVQGAKIYLRAEIDGDASAKEGSAISYNDVLDHIGMTVSKDGVVIASNKTAKLFSQLDAADGLKSNVFIAEVGPKTDPVDLDVTIDVDPAMGNAFQEAAAHITFVFSVEDNELPPPPLELDKHDAYICGYPDPTPVFSLAIRTAHSARTRRSRARSLRRLRRDSTTHRKLPVMHSRISPAAGRASISTARRRVA